MRENLFVGRFWSRKAGANINSHAELNSASAPLLMTKGQGEILKQVQDDGGVVAQDDGMCGFAPRFGFTLIEMLVVVLIIGVLAAVALPSYQIAVGKSKFRDLQTRGEAIVKAEEIYYLTEGEYTQDIRELDLELPAQSYSSNGRWLYFTNGECHVNTSSWYEVYCQYTEGVYNGLGYHRYFKERTMNPSRSLSVPLCRGVNDRAQRICEALGGERTSATSTSYYLSK